MESLVHPDHEVDVRVILLLGDDEGAPLLESAEHHEPRLVVQDSRQRGQKAEASRFPLLLYGGRMLDQTVEREMHSIELLPVDHTIKNGQSAHHVLGVPLLLLSNLAHPTLCPRALRPLRVAR